jgi:hypothetical protein
MMHTIIPGTMRILHAFPAAGYRHPTAGGRPIVDFAAASPYRSGTTTKADREG